MKKRIIVGLSGASGVIYGIRTLKHLQTIENVETHLVMSEGVSINIRIETDYSLRCAEVRNPSYRVPSELISITVQLA